MAGPERLRPPVATNAVWLSPQHEPVAAGANQS
jgi:hypothetical protein